MKKYRVLCFLAYFLAPLLLIAAPPEKEKNITKGIVKIFNTQTEYDYARPWSSPSQWESGGTGFIIKGNRILTCAHVVANAALIRVELEGSIGLYEAKVKCVGHECDLALLEVEDSEFFREALPLRISDKPVQRLQKVEVFGYPVGVDGLFDGAGLSNTEGIVSRVEVGSYGYQRAELLRVQIDAALNPGNSGGPVISAQTVVGIAFCGLGGENMGCMIPNTIIHRFLKEALQGGYKGLPQVGFAYQEMTNKALRDFYHMDPKESGVFITHLDLASPFYKVLLSGDVLLEVEGIPILNTGKVEVPSLGKLKFTHITSMMLYGQELRFKILREGKRLTSSVILSKTKKRVPSCIPLDKPPTYYMLGGIVFQPLSQNLFQSCVGGFRLSGIKWEGEAIGDICYYLSHGSVDPEREEIIVLTQVLQDQINISYRSLIFEILKQVNGTTVRSMKHLAQLINSNRDPFLQLVTESGKVILFNTDELKKKEEHILQTYAVPRFASTDLINLGSSPAR